MADYYVDPNGDGSDGTTLAKAYQTIQAALTARSGANNFIITPGIYAGLVVTTAAGQTLDCSNGEVTIDAEGLGSVGAFRVIHNATVIGTLRITGSATGQYGLYQTAALTADKITINNCSRAFYSTASHTIKTLVVYDILSDSAGYCVFYNSAALVGVINTLIIGNSTPTAMFLNALSTLDIGSLIIHGSRNRAIQAPAAYAGTTTISNAIMTGNCWYDGTPNIIDNASTAGGQILISYSDCLPNPWDSAKLFSGGVTVGAGVISKVPRFVYPNKPGIICFCVDDGPNFSFFQGLVNAAEFYGAKAVFACCGTSTYPLDHAYWNSMYAGLNVMVSNGHEVANHTNNSSVLTGETTSPDGGTLRTQIVLGKTYIEAGIGGGYACTSLIYPTGAYNATVIDETVLSGHTIARKTNVGTGLTFRLNDIKIYEMRGQEARATFGTDMTGDNSIYEKASKYFELMSQIGGVSYIYGHADTTEAEWMEILRAWADSSCLCMTMKEISAYLRTGTDADGNGRRWTRDVISTPNYHLQSNSPCIGAGVSIPSIHEQATPATDLDGKMIHFLPPSIGPYGQGDIKTITTNLIATGYSVRGTAESPAKIKLAEHDLSVDLSGLTDAAPYIQVKAGSKRVAGFVGKGANTYIKGSGGGSSDGIFGSNFG